MFSSRPPASASLEPGGSVTRAPGAMRVHPLLPARRERTALPRSIAHVGSLGQKGKRAREAAQSALDDVEGAVLLALREGDPDLLRAASLRLSALLVALLLAASSGRRGSAERCRRELATLCASASEVLRELSNCHGPGARGLWRASAALHRAGREVSAG